MNGWAAKATLARDRIKKLKEGASAESGLRSEATGLVAGIAAATAAVERSEMMISVARKELESVKAIKAEVNPYTEQLAASKAALKQFQDQLAVLSEQQAVMLEEQAHIEFWVRGFSNQGLPSYVLDSVMPFITTRTNHYLNTLADGDIVMRFDTQRILKSKKDELRDEIDISWEIEGIDDNPPPSGGQFKKMEIATDLSLMDLVASREGKHLDILMMDEVLDGLDDEGRQRVLQLLHALRSRRGTIFVISHEVDMAEIFEKSIVVTKEGGTSTLELRK
jgi:DNA repair exonuclease SbcCD ATPase subunit